MSAHLDPDELGDLSAGLLDEGDASRANDHLATCASCRQDAEALDAVTGLLRFAGEVGPMPTDVADRLDAALLAAAPGDPSDNVRPLARPATRRWWADHRILQAAAAAVLVIAGGAIAVPVLQNAAVSGPETASSADSASGGQAAEAAPDAASDDAGSRTAAKAAATMASGNNYTDESLAREVGRLLSGQEVAAAPSPPAQNSQAGAAAITRLADPSALADCVDELRPGGQAQPLLVDVARYADRSATVIVLEAPDQADGIEIWVVEAGCGRGNARTLHYEMAQRP